MPAYHAQPRRARKSMLYRVPDDAGGIRLRLRTVTGRTNEFRIDAAGGIIQRLGEDGAFADVRVRRGLVWYDVTARTVEDLVRHLDGKLFPTEAAAIKEAEKRVKADAWMHKEPVTPIAPPAA